MSGVAAVHGLYEVDVAGTDIPAITAMNINLGSEIRNEAVSDEVYPRHQALVGQNPRVTFSTNAAAIALGVCGLTGNALASPMVCSAQKYTEGGTREGATSHKIYTINEGLVIPRRLSVDHRGDVSIDYEALITWDGTNDPIVLTESQSLAAAVGDSERFTIGPVTIESISLPQVRSLEIDFGINAQTEGADSELWDRYARIMSIEPTITLRGIDVAWFKDSGGLAMEGLKATHTNTKIFLRKRALGGTFVADETEEHIKFTAEGYAHIDDALDAGGDQAGETSITFALRFDGTNAPLVIDTTAAIA